jgi:peptidase E
VTERHIVAMGGGGFSMDDPVLDAYVLGLVDASRPKVCFLPTATSSVPTYVTRFFRAFPASSFEPTFLDLFDRSVSDLEALLGEQDVIYVGGGNTANLLAVWRVHGLDRALRSAWEAGVVLCGLSAGSMCWFEHGITTSTGRPTAAPALGFLGGSNSVHWSSQPARRAAYRDAIAGGMPAGYGVDDGCALLFEGTRLHEAVAARPQAGAWRVEERDGQVVETPLDVRVLPAQDAAGAGSVPADVVELRALRRGAAVARRHARRVG